MRPLMAVTMNGLADANSPRKFLEFVVENKIFDDPKMELYLTDDLKSGIESKVELHNKFRDRFALDEKWVKKWFVTQDTNPEQSTDLRVD